MEGIRKGVAIQKKKSSRDYHPSTFEKNNKNLVAKLGKFAVAAVEMSHDNSCYVAFKM